MALIFCKECGNQISDTAKSCIKCGAPIKQSVLLRNLFLIFVVLPVVFVTLAPPITPSSESLAIDSSKTSTGNENYREVRSNIGFEWEWLPRDSDLMKINFTVTNNSEYSIKDFSISCRYFTNSDSLIDTNERRVFEIIKAGESKTFESFQMGFIHEMTQKADCVFGDFLITQ